MNKKTQKTLKNKEKNLDTQKYVRYNSKGASLCEGTTAHIWDDQSQQPTRKSGGERNANI